MANNRMYLKNKRTGARVLLAKYSPSTGWGTYHENLVEKMEKLFDENAADPSMWGDNDWQIEYEMQADQRIPEPPA